MPLKLCNTFINMGNKINRVKAVTVLLNASAIWKAFKLNYKTIIKAFIPVYLAISFKHYLQHCITAVGARR